MAKVQGGNAQSAFTGTGHEGKRGPVDPKWGPQKRVSSRRLSRAITARLGRRTVCQQIRVFSGLRDQQRAVTGDLETLESLNDRAFTEDQFLPVDIQRSLVGDQQDRTVLHFG